MMFAEKIIRFNSELTFNKILPDGIHVMNPFADAEAKRVSEVFYKKFYNDSHQRRIILGINPGRFGSGVTGIPFTDTKRLLENCGIKMHGITTHETSSVFIYEMIDAYGGVEKFYQDFYINAVCPLGFTKTTASGKYINYNYYDSKELTTASYDFIIESLRKQLRFGIKNEVCFCLGTGKNFSFLCQINNQFKFFDKIIPLEHPRFVMQYKTKTKQLYIDKYLKAFSNK